jgi:hypothetical protein
MKMLLPALGRVKAAFQVFSSILVFLHSVPEMHAIMNPEVIVGNRDAAVTANGRTSPPSAGVLGVAELPGKPPLAAWCEGVIGPFTACFAAQSGGDIHPLFVSAEAREARDRMAWLYGDAGDLAFTTDGRAFAATSFASDS